jgi:hypothetical protein
VAIAQRDAKVLSTPVRKDSGTADLEEFSIAKLVREAEAEVDAIIDGSDSEKVFAGRIAARNPKEVTWTSHQTSTKRNDGTGSGTTSTVTVWTKQTKPESMALDSAGKTHAGIVYLTKEELLDQFGATCTLCGGYKLDDASAKCLRCDKALPFETLQKELWRSMPSMENLHLNAFNGAHGTVRHMVWSHNTVHSQGLNSPNVLTECPIKAWWAPLQTGYGIHWTYGCRTCNAVQCRCGNWYVGKGLKCGGCKPRR